MLRTISGENRVFSRPNLSDDLKGAMYDEDFVLSFEISYTKSQTTYDLEGSDIGQTNTKLS